MDNKQSINYQLDVLGDPNLFHEPIDISDFLDRIILSTKFVGKYGWIMSIQLSDPIK